MPDKPQVALITGAARGIGYAIAERLAGAGCHLLVNDIVTHDEVEPNLKRLRRRGVKVIYSQADISIAADRNRLLAELDRQLGYIDLLVNNAGVAPEVREDILTAQEASFERVVAINLKGPYFLTQVTAKKMIAQRLQDKNRFFCIVNIASSNSVAASINRGEYCVSKAGVSMATKLWATRLGEFNIAVYEIRPGIIKTDMTSSVTEKYDKMIAEGLLLQNRWGKPDDIGKAVAMLARGDLAYATGQIIYIDGGQLVARL